MWRNRLEGLVHRIISSNPVRYRKLTRVIGLLCSTVMILTVWVGQHEHNPLWNGTLLAFSILAPLVIGIKHYFATNDLAEEVWETSRGLLVKYHGRKGLISWSSISQIRAPFGYEPDEVVPIIALRLKRPGCWGHEVRFLAHLEQSNAVELERVVTRLATKAGCLFVKT